MTVRSALILLFTLYSYVPSAAQTITRFSIIINELFPDPTPVIGLPANEFIELRNVSATAVNLKNWKLSDGSSTATITTDFNLLPDSFVIICSNAAVASYSLFGATIGVSNFPSLNNDADIITLYSSEGNIIHSVSYTNAWYQNEVKRDGGWTLEMIDGDNPCTGMLNWKASINNNGGTPGQKNSVDAINTDELSPALIRTYTLDSTTIVAVFDEPVDSTNASSINNYSLDNGIGNPVSAIPVAPLFTEVQLQFSASLHQQTVYTLTTRNITDCKDNNIAWRNTAKAGIPQPADNTDIAINELLFNPKADGYDYIELYNRGNKVLDLKQLYISGRNNTGNLNNITVLSTNSKLFFPEEYIVLTENSSWVQQNYMVKDASRIIELSSIPSLPDDKGTLVLTNMHGIVVDELQYNKQWHFALLSSDEGISLERINYNEPTQNKTNWTSAASTAGFGTPAYQNSQFRADMQAQGTIDITPAVFSPDNNGLDDFTHIHYKMNDPGYVANIIIYDIAGRPVRNLARNATLSISGNFRWDGLDDHLKKLPVGAYIILTEIFNLQGKTKKFKNVVTLAKKF